MDAKEEGKRNAEELQRCVDEVKDDAEEQGLAIVVTWIDEYGGRQSVTLNPDDSIKVGFKK